MMHRPGLLSGALCLTVVVAGVASVALRRADRPADPVTVAPDSATAEVSTQAPADDTRPGSWSLRAGGWYIRVDGAEIEIPTLAQQVGARPATVRPRASIMVPISPYDQLILHHAQTEGFDWRLIAALIFEESHFNPASESDKGAYGLMQVRPIAAQAVGAERFKAPNDNLDAGTRYLRLLDGIFHEAQGEDRIGLVLAAYNMGPGHVHDAQRLARYFGVEANRWEGHMDQMVRLLEQPSIYKYLPHGFAKGRETVAYVRRTIDRYHRYAHQTTDGPTTGTEAVPLPVNGAPADG